MHTLFTLVLLIALMIVAISRWKVHSFLAILATAFILAVSIGIPLSDIPTLIEQGFSSIIGSIGLIIILGALIGVVLEQTGAALKLATVVVTWIGDRFPNLSILIMGWIVSIPVFCDSGFVLLNPIRKALCNKTKASSIAMSIALSAGLYTSHVLIPPTPGVIAASGIVGLESNLLLVMALGLAVSPFCLVPAYFFARHIGKKNPVSTPITTSGNNDANTNATSELWATPSENLPNGVMSALPILMPILLMAFGSITATTLPSETELANIARFLGKPTIALAVGFLCSLPLLLRSKQLAKLSEITDQTLRSVSSIIFITAAGSVLGKIIIASGFVEIVKIQFSAITHMGLLFPFLIAALLKSAQGSSTVAMITTASILGMFSAADSLMVGLGFDTPFLAGLCVMAIGAGAMTVSHANDSYFWVVTGFGEMNPEDGYRSQTLMTLITGLGGIIGIHIIYAVYLLMT